MNKSTIALTIAICVSSLLIGEVRGQGVSASAALPSKTAPDDLDDTLTAIFPHGIPLDRAELALKSRDAVKRLEKILDSWADQDAWENATLLLGLSADPNAYGRLTEFFQRDDSPAAHAARCEPSLCRPREGRKQSKVTSSKVYYAKANVPVAIGLWIYQVSQSDLFAPGTRAEALSYLKSCSQPRIKEFWAAQIKWNTENYARSPFLYADLSAQCIQGLGLSGSDDAETYLDWLAGHVSTMRAATVGGSNRAEVAKHGYAPELVTSEFFNSFAEAVASARKTNRLIAAHGLKAYYARPPER